MEGVEHFKKKMLSLESVTFVWIETSSIHIESETFAAREILESFEETSSTSFVSSQCGKSERREIKRFLRHCRDTRVSFVRVLDDSSDSKLRVNVYDKNQKNVFSILQEIFSSSKIRVTKGPMDTNIVVRFPMKDEDEDVTTLLNDLPFALRRTLSIASRRRSKIRGNVGVIKNEKNQYYVRFQFPDMFQGVLKTSMTARQTKISFESPYAHCLDFGNGGRVDAVSSSVLFVGENGSMAIVSNLTLLPNKSWADIAGKCVSNALYFSESSSYSDDDDDDDDDNDEYDSTNRFISIIREHLGNLDQGPDMIDGAVKNLFEASSGVVVVVKEKKKKKKKKSTKKKAKSDPSKKEPKFGDITLLRKGDQ